MKIKRGTVHERIVNGNTVSIIDGVVMHDGESASIDVFRAPEWARGLFASVSAGKHVIHDGTASVNIPEPDFILLWQGTEPAEDDSLFVTGDLSVLDALAGELGWLDFMNKTPCYLTDFSPGEMVFTCPEGDVGVCTDDDSQSVFPPLSTTRYFIRGDERLVDKNWKKTVSAALGNTPLLVFDDNDEWDPVPRGIALEGDPSVKGVVPLWR